MGNLNNRSSELEDKNSNQDLVVGSDGSMTDSSSNANQPLDKSVDSEVNDLAVGGAPSEAVDSMSAAPQLTTQAPLNVQPVSNSNNASSEASNDANSVVEAPAQSSEMASVTDSLTETPEENRSSNSIDFTQESLVSQMTPKLQENSTNNSNIITEKPKDNHPHRNNKTFAIVIAIVIALLLSALAVYVYLSTQENTQKSQPTTINETQRQDNSNTIPEETTIMDEPLDTTGTQDSTTTDSAIDSMNPDGQTVEPVIPAIDPLTPTN